MALISPQSSGDYPTGGHEHWPPESTAAKPKWIMPGWGATIWRGIRGRCPHCGEAPIFDGYLRVHERCATCAAPLGQMPADDTPPYIAMVVVLHFVGLFTVLSFKFHFRPDAIEVGLLLIALVLVCLGALRMAKGAVIGILLKLDTNRERSDE